MAEENNVQEELNLDKKVTVRSIAAWPTGFVKIADGYGDVTITANGTARLTRNEIIAQVHYGNKLFTGIDGLGSHATLYIDDAPTRQEVGFDTDSTEQVVFNKAKIKELFANKSQSTFERSFKEYIKTRAEKKAAMDAIVELKINDYKKIRFAETYTGYKMN